jgi:hypothetical protein
MATQCGEFNPYEQAPDLPTVMAYCQRVWVDHTWGGCNCWGWWDQRPLTCWREAHQGGLEQGLQLWQFPPYLFGIWERATALERSWQSNANRWQ